MLTTPLEWKERGTEQAQHKPQRTNACNLQELCGGPPGGEGVRTKDACKGWPVSLGLLLHGTIKIIPDPISLLVSLFHSILLFPLID